MNPKIDFAPGNMPTEEFNSDTWARNALCGLAIHDVVDIHYESNFEESSGEEVGEWTVYLEDGSKSVEVSSRSILASLWAATNQMAHEMDEVAKAKEAKIAAALAKLTQEEQRLLGVRAR